MKKILMPALLGAALLAAPAATFALKAPKAATSATAKIVSYKLQPQLSTLGWEGKAVTHGHNGTMQFASGDLQVNGNQVVGGTVVVDMKSMKATDITDASNHAKFVGHMSSDDFFGAEKYPTSTFKITSVKPIAGAAANADNATITGDMTIKGVTQQISFPAKVGVKNGVAAATGKVTIDRTKFGLKYGSKTFFDSIGDKAIYDTFDLTFNVVAKQG
ncbi:YceI family protein [Hymenobacter cheonanensis]|uniref:YceI family protein n=1 Tax=Hymenobacter sp. CA2-7 TaxID=3063993 RepID=UPI002713DE7C|nr:YceI family protein [Hymenobacter sp. CA2-7]MDO7887080.1 YceI family protein [Hymenobacter sp. CA2-7]